MSQTSKKKNYKFIKKSRLKRVKNAKLKHEKLEKKLMIEILWLKNKKSLASLAFFIWLNSRLKKGFSKRLLR